MNYVTLSDNEYGNVTIINITVLSSTFNQPNTTYYVLIDDGFVKDRRYQEPIIGIHTNVWTFKTRMCFINFFHFN